MNLKSLLSMLSVFALERFRGTSTACRHGFTAKNRQSKGRCAIKDEKQSDEHSGISTRPQCSAR